MARGQQQWTFYHLSAFLLTFFGYACFHATRKSFSNVKLTISQQWTPSFHNSSVNELKPDYIWNSHNLFQDEKHAEYFLGILDTLFMAAYATGLFISGIIGDRLDMRKVLTFGMCSSAIMVILFGVVTEWFHFYNIPLYVFLWILNGLFQSTGWPSMVAIMANWFGKSSRGAVMGLWSGCASAGNIIGSLLSASVIQYGYQYAFLAPACLLFGFGIVNFFGLVSHPRDVGLPSQDEDDDNEVYVTEDQETLINDDEEITDEDDAGRGLLGNRNPKITPQSPKLTFYQALLLPGVILYSVSYACLKLVNYAFFFWLPLYLTLAYGWTQKDADKLSIWYDVGGIIAGFIGGFISDRMKVRAPVVCLMLACAAPSLYFYSISPNDKTINAVLMAVVGFFIGGPSALISSSISADMGRQDGLAGNKEALATVAGIVDGTGSVGAALGQILVPVIHQKLNWHWVFYLFIVMSNLTLLCILPVLVREIRSMACWQRRFHGTPGISIQAYEILGRTMI